MLVGMRLLWRVAGRSLYRSYAEKRVTTKCGDVVDRRRRSRVHKAVDGSVETTGDGVGKKRKVATVVPDGYQRVSRFYAKARRVDGGCSLMDTNGHCNCSHAGSVEKDEKDSERKKDSAKARVSGKHSNEEGDGGTGEKK